MHRPSLHEAGVLSAIKNRNIPYAAGVEVTSGGGGARGQFGFALLIADAGNDVVARPDQTLVR